MKNLLVMVWSVNDFTALGFSLIVLLIIFFALRGLMLWYWKVNDVLKNLQIQNNILKLIALNAGVNQDAIDAAFLISKQNNSNLNDITNKDDLALLFMLINCKDYDFETIKLALIEAKNRNLTLSDIQRTRLNEFSLNNGKGNFENLYK